ncbi:hypothetical protein FJZ31_10265 [Candidatus Poribacteria bacterium]|nr:hypothetical protein [Candidatus Poribacteria bacterium]
MPKIKDLIEVPPVKTVIELATVRDASAEDLAQLIKLTETFVVTEDIERCLRVILDQIANYPGEGMGFFLTGNFGSGKSHFLAVLSLLLQHSWAWNPITAQCEALKDYESKLNERRFLVMQIPMLEYRQTGALEDIVFQSVESAFANRHQIFVSLASDSAFLEQFEKYILPAHRQEIDAFLESKLKTRKSWDTLRNESLDDALNYAQEYLQTAGQTIPFRLKIDRQQAWDKLMATLNDYDFDGVAILIDELSEFLRSKPDMRALNEDTRFLQFLGEKSAHAPVWIIAALQEAIEKTGDISQTTFNKIKDRYQRRLELSTKHIRELIDRRLIVKKSPPNPPVHGGANAIETIKEAYGKLKKSFGHLKIGEEEFVQIYPVHPETLELLDVNTRFFSQRRGVVDFIHYQVKGDTSRQIEGMLERDYTHLLTPDKIFDHFALRIREQVDLSPYYQIYKDYFERQIPRLFADEQDQQCALRLVKILILLKLSPVEYTRTVRELADMVMYNLTDFGGELNYEYIEEQILKRFLTELSYIKVQRSDEPFSAVYYIDLEANIIDQIKAKQREIILSLSDDDGRMLDAVFEQMVEGPIPFAHLRGTYSERKNILWQNTMRQGWVNLCNLLDISEAELKKVMSDLRKTEGDFVVYLGMPFNVAKQLEHFQDLTSHPLPSPPSPEWRGEGGEVDFDRFVNGVIYWLPAEIKKAENISILKDFYAQKQLYEEYLNDEKKAGNEALELLRESLQQSAEQAKELIQEAYFAGKVYTAIGRLNLDLQECKLQNFNVTLGKLIQKPLNAIFPKHLAPQQELTTWRVIGELVDDFVRPAVVARSESQKYLQSAIEAIAKPFGIVRKKRRSFELDFDLTAPLLAQILDLIPEGEINPPPAPPTHPQPLPRGERGVNGKQVSSLVEYNWIYWQLRKSEYGVPGFIIDLLLFALIRKGYLTAYHNANRSNLSQLSLPLAKTCTHLGRGQLIKDEYRWQLGEVSQTLLHEPLASYDVSKQEEVWKKLCVMKERLSRDLNTSRERLQMLNERIFSADEELSEVMSGISRTQSLLAEIKPALGSKEGLEHFLNTISTKLDDEDGLLQLMEKADAVKFFADRQSDVLLSINGYLSSPHLVIPEKSEYDELRQLREAVLRELKLDEKLVFHGGAAALAEAFQLFKNVYSDRYIAEHKRANAVDAEALQKLRTSLEYDLLSRLSQITLISVPNDISKVENLIAGELQRACNRLTRETIDKFPACACGFKLGTVVKALTASELLEMMKSSIRQYLTTLQEPPCRDQISDYIAKMEQLEHAFPKTQLTSLLSLQIEPLSDELYAGFSQLLTPETIEHLNQALEGGIRIVSRDISQLSQQLLDRKYPKAKVLEIINQWLDGEEELTEDVYIWVSSTYVEG